MYNTCMYNSQFVHCHVPLHVTCPSAANLPPRFVLQKKLETQKNYNAQGTTGGQGDKRVVRVRILLQVWVLCKWYYSGCWLWKVGGSDAVLGRGLVYGGCGKLWWYVWWLSPGVVLRWVRMLGHSCVGSVLWFRRLGSITVFGWYFGSNYVFKRGYNP